MAMRTAYYCIFGNQSLINCCLMSSKVSFFFMPLTIFWLILLVGLLFLLLKLKRTALLCGIFSIIWLAMISFLFLPDLLARSIEKRYPPLLNFSQYNLKDSINILVLSAGYTSNKNLPPNDQLSLNSLGRLMEAIRLHRLLNASQIVFFGYVPGKNVSEGEPFMKTALALGVNENEIRFLGTPENTQMEAFDYTKKFGKNSTLILVTDAIHMPRAMFLFRKAGQSPIPAPTNHMAKSYWKNGITDWFPAASNIAMMEHAMHEIGGLVYANIFYRGVGNGKKEKK
jgi:uncharacterized SAM-binding protein YcdF (DUF218 family)